MNKPDRLFFKVWPNNRFLRIPFYITPSSYYCAQTCIMMALRYFYPDREFTYKELARKSAKHSKFGTFSVGIAKALAEYGLKVKFFTSGLKCNKNKFSSLEYYKKYEDFLGKADEVIKDSIKSGVLIKEGKLDFDDIIRFFKEGCIMIPLLNWNLIKGERGFRGHFVVISGIDKQNVYVHNPGPNHPEPFKQLKKELFYKAWSSFGTNNDIVVVRGKN